MSPLTVGNKNCVLIQGEDIFVIANARLMDIQNSIEEDQY